MFTTRRHASRKFWCCLTVALSLPAAAATAGAVLDQEYVPPPFDDSTGRYALIVSNSQSLAQTLTVGIAGILDHVAVEVARDPLLPAAGMTLEIRPTDLDGVPTTAVLASIPIAAEDVPTRFAFMDFDVRPFHIDVTRGEVLAIVLRTDAAGRGGVSPFGWQGAYTNGYPSGSTFFDVRGSGWMPLGWDLGFRTTVTIPEPSAATLLISAAVAIAASVSVRYRRIGNGPRRLIQRIRLQNPQPSSSFLRGSPDAPPAD